MAALRGGGGRARAPHHQSKLSSNSPPPTSPLSHLPLCPPAVAPPVLRGAAAVLSGIQMACRELQSGETLASLKRESDTLKKKLEEERGKLNDVECKWILISNLYLSVKVMQIYF